MKTLTLATVAMLSATSLSAADLGGGFSLGGELDVNANLTDNVESYTLKPIAGYTVGGINFEANTIVNLDKISDYKINVAYEVRYDVHSSLELYGLMKTNDSWNTDDVTFGATFSF